MASTRPPPRRQRRPRRARVVRAAVILLAVCVASGSLAWWARGRGYKTRLLAKLWPESPYALKHPTVVGIRPANRDDDVMPDAFVACDVNLPNPGRVIDKTTLDG